jgi:PEP-CTERM motif
MRTWARFTGFLALGLTAPWAVAVELLTNGNFETGTLAGWAVTDQAGGTGSWFNSVPSTATPISGNATASNLFGGSFYAVSDQTGPGAHALTQSFVVAPGATSVFLSFQMFVNNWNPTTIIDPVGLDFTVSPNQHGRVDLLTAGATAFDTGAGVLSNIYIGADTGELPHPWLDYLYDITALVGGGGTFQIRFAEVDNQLFFNMGVDNVSIVADFAQVPEPDVLALLGLAALGGVSFRRRRG